MNRIALLFTFIFAGLPALLADVPPVEVIVPENKLWVGQRVPFYVEIRSLGQFAGSASFDLPDVPGVLFMEVGSPVVDSRRLEGQTWLIQIHEFALFAQRAGTLEVPPFPVRFASREGFTGPALDRKEVVPAQTFEILRPAGSDGIRFLITTEKLEVAESWDPQPGPARVGDVFKRTITQRAPDVSGMALAPAPSEDLENARVYNGDPLVEDKSDRGSFIGRREETISYVLTKPGTFELPPVTYVWWNPISESLQSQTLPGLSIEVAAAPTESLPPPESANPLWIWMGAAIFFCLATWQRKRLMYGVRHCVRQLNPPHRVAARELLSACRSSNARETGSAWIRWLNTQHPSFTPPPALQAAVADLHQHLYGRSPAPQWDGRSLARAFKQARSSTNAASVSSANAPLPLLNH